ncbi:MAG: 16S rRNA (uracil(1498)-N(3))-methyltransferase [Proteobacteria bacterium]|nr:16S rRNA (uracil(1498)-N(3))-methyltransferase [Pseudomonadota bacterium]NOG60433.1 16S rRNA (uracil(1498)-N(3))-methyltransferase [Pseudomonadota bacterium]
MRIPRLFIDIPLSAGESVSIPRDKVHHLTHVLRMHVGDAVKLFNDSGNEFDATIIALTKKNAEVEIKELHQVDNESSLKITLCLAVARGQQMDYSIQKAVELGVNSVIPVMSEFSNVKLRDDRLNNKMMHWQNIIISATEQCGRNRLAQLQLPVSFSKCLVMDKTKTRLILQPGCQQSMPAITPINNQLTLIIGPEGGFSETEVDEAIEAGAMPVSLGPRILRAETAVVSALSNAQQLWGDLN